MARLVDTLLRSDVLGHEQKRTLGSMPIIRGDNVAAYYYADSGKDEWVLTDDFPTVAPPFGRFAVEIHAEAVRASLARRYADDWQVYFGRFPKAWVVIFEGREHDPAIPYDVFRTQDPLIGVKWQLNAILVSWPATGNYKPFFPGGQYYCLDVDGKAMTFPNGEIATRGYWFVNQEVRPEDVSEERWAHIWSEDFGMLIRPALLAISFMHCKNVVQKVQPPAEFEIKRAQKKGYPTPITYRVLEIEPMKQVLRTEGKSEQVGLQRALHICRGHFKTYADKPLFGRVKGTFWWPSTVRGSLSHGAVIKDYAVQAPKA